MIVTNEQLREMTVFQLQGLEARVKQMIEAKTKQAVQVGAKVVLSDNPTVEYKVVKLNPKRFHAQKILAGESRGPVYTIPYSMVVEVIEQ